ncbi:MAG: hypothetical protein BM556_07390 [Bacteriovorax sp. MedPE-SWde]|nr:MAG: hypothetical protein BM556_07390 [Bacteriovorax sp. MedPE-SWde]
MNKFILLVSIAALTSCASLNKNMTKVGTAKIRGGIYKNTKWDSSLEFKRVSWFQELTMLYDVIYTEIPEESSFRTWFSRDERRRLKDCGQVFLSMNYSYTSEKISHSLFKAQMRDHRYEHVVAPDFTRSLKMHPDFQQLSLSLHKVNLYCRKNKLEDPIFINFPNFEELKL